MLAAEAPSDGAVAVNALTEVDVLAALDDVPDPEIPAISVVDLGVIGRIEAGTPGGTLRVELLPTFVGCPALDPMREAVARRLRAIAPDRSVEVTITYAPPWTADRITPRGRARLTASGFAPPAAVRPVDVLTLDAAVACPFCGSTRTVLDNPFGPTPCRSIRYCTSCRQPFEHFKAV